MENKAAFLNCTGTSLAIQHAPFPRPEAHEVLIRNHAIAINPVDYKIQDTGVLVRKWPYVLGEDIAGEVIEVGSAVTSLQKGDRVAAFAINIVTQNQANAGFQLYTTTPASMAVRIPDSVDFTDAVVLPLGLATATGALFSREYLGIAPPQASLPVPTGSKDKVILIWGGSSSVGSCAVQLCAAAGLTVLTTSSTKNYVYAKDIGAAETFDYNDDEVVDKLVKATRGKEVVGAYDAISSEASLAACVNFLYAVGGGKLSLTLAGTKLPDMPESVKAVAGRPPLQGPDGGEPIWRQVWKDFLETGLQNGKLKAKPDAHILKGGLERLQEGLDLVRKGVSAKKIVVDLAE
ncbi:zinc-binding oxidoreductase CipB [Paraphaeosphaeria sporulosa]|uniref:Zinc-binding oxidoreductase CipB n=1 Tax=Paraphaeosphaeria sporulosa TaxID=1460663 RepID=A0A177CY84_9PLEO|nr:zinc-binding oxidoreductase CipB [Paraphaeosphaeria sporulosa]OAG11842.1 zinc-binding oxidoreductase CipB [Paraphaeosphaeria sporulosa]